VRAARPLVSPRTAAQKRRYARGMEDVERRLTVVALRPPGRLGAACATTLRAGGKRVRPLLTLLCARADAELAEPVLRAAAAVELLHMATLVHDDVLDGADLRRGRPTIAREHGPAMAVSAGNFLLARAFSELATTGDPVAVAALSSAAVGLSEGEVLQRDQTRLVTLARAEYERRCELKTADLFAVACRLGARLSGACEESVEALAEYGRLIGLAFQVFDDILDCSGSEAETGKRPGADIRDGTITLPLLFALETRPELTAQLSRNDLDAADVAAVLRVVNESGALQRARAVAMRYIEEARDVLDGCPRPVERDLLAQVAAQVVARYS
jgi:geranylgeranyl pyrophosphate synthase